jgi:hypothetical protein
MKRKYIFSLILIVGMIAGMTQTQAIVSEIEFEGVKIAFDLYHGGYHANDIDNIVANLSVANTVVFINETWELPTDLDVLFLTEADSGENWTTTEIADIADWMALGNKLLWAAGDSDYAGLFDPTKINDVLDELGAIVRLDGSSIEDPDFNDGSAYRVAAPYFGVGDVLYDTAPVLNASEGCTAGAIFHGPCAIIAYDGYYYKDLRYGQSIFPERVWTLMRYSENSTALDSDVSDDWEGLDLYSNSTVTGDYPALVYEHLIDMDSHIVLGGEAIYSDYKYMYDQKTENGAYNGGVQFGQVVVNNILNWLLPFPVVEETSAAFALIPLIAIGAIYAIMKRK